MLHFSSMLSNSGGNGVPRRTDSLNATQQKAAVGPAQQMFLTIEQELHDARRVGAHGQEDDLRGALNMVINRVTELSSLLSEAYKSNADLGVQLNVAKSNLQLVIANNEMLEEALKAGSGQRDVGWRRASGGPISARSADGFDVPTHSPNGSSSPNSSPTEPSGSNSRFFKTFFNARPGTPTLANAPPPHHLNSPSMPSLHGAPADEEALSAALQAARANAEKAKGEAVDARKAAEKAAQEKASLEAEIESLSQALFEEANKMVATERKMRAEAEGELVKLRRMRDEIKEELTEAKEEREALKSALKLIEGENVELRSASRMGSRSSSISLSEMEAYGTISRSRSSSQLGTKSPVTSPPDSPALDSSPVLASSSSSSPNLSESAAERGPVSHVDTMRTPRRVIVPLDLVHEDDDNLSPPPTAVAPPPDDPWAGA